MRITIHPFLPQMLLRRILVNRREKGRWRQKFLSGDCAARQEPLHWMRFFDRNRATAFIVLLSLFKESRGKTAIRLAVIGLGERHELLILTHFPHAA